MRLRTLLVAALLVGGCETPSSELEARVKKLEEFNKKYAEALDALQQAYDQQKQQAAAQDEKRAREEPAPDAIFAVDIAPDLKNNQVEGPATAGVTIVEAWDFA
jgi:outer membrane murein-binding lipoprotein Lpp